MAPSCLAKLAVRPRAFACPSAAVATAVSLFRQPQRGIGQGVLLKRIDAERSWKERARRIRSGEEQSMMAFLEERGFIKDIAGDKQALDDLMTDKRIGAYVGVDPTGPSLHVGNLVPLMALFWFYLKGYTTVSILGGATARVGDPSGRTSARSPMSRVTRAANMAAMHTQLKSIWQHVESLGRRYGVEKEWAMRRGIANNNMWLNTVSITEFLGTLGNGIRMGELLSRDVVKTRLEGDGMSFAELAYPLLQAWDWWHVYHKQNIQLQIGGSDQYGNIITGINAVNHIRNTIKDPVIRKEQDENGDKMVPYGFTTPLLTTASGEKFGKSAGNAVWLDVDLLSSFDLYQYFLRTADTDVERYLKLFTFIPTAKITEIVEKHFQDPPKRLAQHTLAWELVALAHGIPRADQAQTEHQATFARGANTISLAQLTGGAVTAVPATDDVLTPHDLARSTAVEPPVVPEKPGHLAHKTVTPQKRGAFSDVTSVTNEFAPHTTADNMSGKYVTLPRSLVYAKSFSKVLWHAGLVGSKAEGNRIVQQQGAYVASRPGYQDVGDWDGSELTWVPIRDARPGEAEKFVVEGTWLGLRIGKWRIKFVKIVEDEEFKRMGITAPGWEEELHHQGKGAAKEQATDEQASQEEKKEDLVDSDALNSLNEAVEGSATGGRSGHSDAQPLPPKTKREIQIETRRKEKAEAKAKEAERKQQWESGGLNSHPDDRARSSSTPPPRDQSRFQTRQDYSERRPDRRSDHAPSYSSRDHGSSSSTGREGFERTENPHPPAWKQRGSVSKRRAAVAAERESRSKPWHTHLLNRMQNEELHLMKKTTPGGGRRIDPSTWAAHRAARLGGVPHLPPGMPSLLLLHALGRASAADVLQASRRSLAKKRWGADWEGGEGLRAAAPDTRDGEGEEEEEDQERRDPAEEEARRRRREARREERQRAREEERRRRRERQEEVRKSRRREREEKRWVRWERKRREEERERVAAAEEGKEGKGGKGEV